MSKDTHKQKSLSEPPQTKKKNTTENVFRKGISMIDSFYNRMGDGTKPWRAPGTQKGAPSI